MILGRRQSAAEREVVAHLETCEADELPVAVVVGDGGGGGGDSDVGEGNAAALDGRVDFEVVAAAAVVVVAVAVVAAIDDAVAHILAASAGRMR